MKAILILLVAAVNLITIETTAEDREVITDGKRTVIFTKDLTRDQVDRCDQ